MIFQDEYFIGVGNAIEFLIALGSIMGLLGLIVGLLGVLFSSSFNRSKFAYLIFVSIVLIAVCGATTGIKYFRLHI